MVEFGLLQDFNIYNFIHTLSLVNIYFSLFFPLFYIHKYKLIVISLLNSKVDKRNVKLGEYAVSVIFTHLQLSVNKESFLNINKLCLEYTKNRIIMIK